MRKRGPQGQGSCREKNVNGKTYWEGRITVNGKQRSVSAKTQADCLRKMKELQRQIDEGNFTEPLKITVQQWLNEWLSEYCTDVKPRTLNEYQSIAKNHLIPLFSKAPLQKVKLNELTKKQCQDVINTIAKRPSERTGKPLSAKTIKCIFTVLHASLEKAVELEMINRNVAKNITLPKQMKQEVKPLTNDDIAQFVKAIEKHRFRDLFLVDLFTGMREGEICGLSWEAIDFEKGIITIKQQLQRQKETGQYIIVTTKNSKIRKIKPASFVMNILKSIKVKQFNDRISAGKDWSNEYNLVFTKENGENLCPHVVYENFKRIVKDIGRPDAKFHTLRHTYATLSIANGDDIKTVQEALGHYSAAFTADVYGHTTSEMQKASAERMEKYALKMDIA